MHFNFLCYSNTEKFSIFIRRTNGVCKSTSFFSFFFGGSGPGFTRTSFALKTVGVENSLKDIQSELPSHGQRY